MGWLEQSALLVTVAVLAIVAVGFGTWWLGQRGQAAV
jgi:type II secretory pathway pseudopilin PulG